jgi:hypothetical protein
MECGELGRLTEAVEAIFFTTPTECPSGVSAGQMNP